MIARRLSIDPALLVLMFSRPDAWRVVANRLPEDAKVARVESSIGVDGPCDTHLWITSSVFQATDSLDLPAVEFRSSPVEPFPKPVEVHRLNREERLKFESELQAVMARSDRKVTVYDADGNPI